MEVNESLSEAGEFPTSAPVAPCPKLAAEFDGVLNRYGIFIGNGWASVCIEEEPFFFSGEKLPKVDEWFRLCEFLGDLEDEKEVFRVKVDVLDVVEFCVDSGAAGVGVLLRPPWFEVLVPTPRYIFLHRPLSNPGTL